MVMEEINKRIGWLVTRERSIYPGYSRRADCKINHRQKVDFQSRAKSTENTKTFTLNRDNAICAITFIANTVTLLSPRINSSLLFKACSYEAWYEDYTCFVSQDWQET